MQFSDFIVYLKFIAPDSVLITLSSKQFMYRTYFVEFKFRWYLELFLFSFIFSVFPELTQCYFDVSKIAVFDWDIKVCKLYCLLKILNIKVLFMWSESHVKGNLLEETEFCLSNKHWLLHSLILFSYTRSVSWWSFFKRHL